MIQPSRIIPNASYPLRWEGSTKRFSFTAAEVEDHRGQLLVYGYIHSIELLTPLGHERNLERPACFPLFPSQPDQEIELFIAALKGNPIYLQVGDRRLPVANYNRPSAVLEKKEMMGRAMRLIQAWEEWQELNRLPSWLKVG